MLEKYETTVPGLGEKIVKWTSDESQHRRDMEKTALDEHVQVTRRGQLAGFAIALVGLIVAGIVVSINPNWAVASVASVIAMVSVGGPLAARRLADRWKSRERDNEPDA